LSLPQSLFLAAFAASLGFNVYQARTIDNLRGPRPTVDARLLPEGVPIPPLRVTDAAQNSTYIQYSGPLPTVLYVFSPSCGWCLRNEANITTLASAKSKEYRFIGLSTTSTDLDKYVRDHKPPFPVYTNVPKMVASALGLTSTPQMLVVSQEGRLLKHWRGAPIEVKKADVESFFNVRLPGLIEPKPKPDQSASRLPPSL